MGLKAKLTKEEFDNLDDPLKGLYKESGSDYLLDAEGVEDVTGLKTALDKERQAAADARRQLNAERERFKDVDPARYRELLTESESREQDNLKKSGKWEEWKQGFENQKKKELEALNAKVQELESRIKKFTLEDHVRSAALKSGVIKDLIDDVVIVTSGRFKLDGSEKIQVVDKDGETPLDITVDSFFSDVFKTQRPQYYAASNAGGSGAPAGSSGNGGVRVTKRADFDRLGPLQQSAFMKDVRAGKAQLVD